MSDRRLRWPILIAGIVLGQALLYGPALIGRTVLVPLEILALPGFYLPQTPEVRAIEIGEPLRSDPVLAFEPWRRFATTEVRAGRLPRWNPHLFAGTPAVLWPQYSPFAWPSYLDPSPRSLAWTQLLVALVAGLGVYGLFRRVLRLGFWPAAVGAWCYPLSAYFVLWQGFSPVHVFAWLPWTLWATDAALARPGGRAGAILAAATAVTCLSGQIDVAAQVLLAAGLWALGRLLEQAVRRTAPRRLAAAAATAAAGWLLGLALASPYLLPLADYFGDGRRAAARHAGVEDRPPVGLAALPQVVLPEMYGASREGSLRIAADNRLESSATTYVGLLATLLLAPLAAASRRHRWHNLRWLALVVVGLGWSLDLPGVVALLRLPGVGLLSHNRFVFAAALALLALAATGLERLLAGPIPRRFLLAPAALLLVVLVFAWYRSLVPPEPVRSELEQRVRAGQPVRNVVDLDDVAAVRRGFRRGYSAGATLAAVGLGALVLARRRPRAVTVAVAAMMVIDLVGYGRLTDVQSSPALDYPPLPILEPLVGRPGRVLGVGCLPPNLVSVHGLADVRGYDAVDPARYVELLGLAADPRRPGPSHAATLWLTPRPGFLRPEGVHLHPVLDLLGTRWLIFRGVPPAGIQPAARAPDYWLMENQRALPRLTVSARVETVADDGERLRRLADPVFDPRRVAYLETAVELPPGDATGVAEIIAELPARLEIAARMETPGLLRIADRWHPDWHARLDGRPLPILRVDHALRGVVLPAGEHRLTLVYRSSSLRRGLVLAVLAAVVVAGWWLVSSRRARGVTTGYTAGAFARRRERPAARSPGGPNAPERRGRG